MIIREMREEDLDQVAYIEQMNFSTPWTREDFHTWLNRQEGLFLAAELEGRVIGYCGVILAPPEGDITNVSVLSEHRGRGVGSMLVSKLLKQIEDRKIERIFLEVRESNQQAIRLYEQLGFNRIGVRKRYYEKPEEDALVMVREG
ncbi:MAG: ribosomal protein S18-alanine N-acetyltransferase [Lachnospiraceae bacterium]|nr:ribosomal protein S18-alanine N-acetyltransferase [Lachnospiraceae bacterium]